MDEYVYSASLFWKIIATAGQIGYQLFPFVFLLASIIWVIRKKDGLSVVGLSGAGLLAVGMVLGRTIEKMDAVSSGGYTQPPVGENPLIWLLFVHGINLGLFLLSASLLVYFLKERAQKEKR